MKDLTQLSDAELLAYYNEMGSIMKVWIIKWMEAVNLVV